MGVTVVDSIMGSGKTSWSIKFINESKDRNFLYITPFLDEIDRIVSSTEKDFVSPQNRGSGKLENLNELLSRQEDIAATHELFKHLDEPSKAAIRAGGYTLILDEVLNVLQPLNFKKCDFKILMDSGCITVDKSNYVVWNPDKHLYDTVFNTFKELAENHQVVCLNEILLLWVYPPEIFSLFDEVYVLTYLFDASILKYYFDTYSICYETKSIKDGQMVEYYEPDTAAYADLIDIYEGVMNTNFSNKSNSLSKTWFQITKSREDIKRLGKNVRNYIRNVNKAKQEEVMWTTYKDYKSKLQGKGYTKAFVSCNCRATNMYAETHVLAYCVNIFVHPSVIQFFAERGIAVNQEKYALSEMLQWIWRSRIRNGKPVSIYIPSERMRTLLKQWMKI